MTQGVSTERLPANPIEAAFSADLMRALLARLLVGRKRPLVGTYAAGEQAAGVLLRVGLDRRGTIRAWLEEPEPEMRHGVPYIVAPVASDLTTAEAVNARLGGES